MRFSVDTSHEGRDLACPKHSCIPRAYDTAWQKHINVFVVE